MIELVGITVYPIKSLDGVDLEEAEFLAGGALRHDRRYALVDEQGQFINGKRNAEVHRIRTGYDLDSNQVSVGVQGLGGDERFELDSGRPALEEWFSDYFGCGVRLQENPEGGFPDDDVYPGPTLISTETIRVLASWFDGIDELGMRRRLRANLEISAGSAFWEDRLLDSVADRRPVPFRIGAVNLLGGNPCQRCPVPTRDPVDGQPTAGFRERFAARRQATLPDWADPARFDHYYRVSVNTRAAAGCAGLRIRLGDPLAGPGT